jgi:two-component sensor histidine kinase
LNLFSPPKSSYNNYFDQGKYNLTWRLVVVYFFVSIILAAVHVGGTIGNLIIAISGIIITSSFILIIHLTRKHIFVAKATVILSTIVIQYAIFDLLNPSQVIDLLWIVIFTLYAFYTINVIWGIASLIINFIGLSTYQFILGPNNNYSKSLFELSTSDQIDYYANIIFGGFAICMILYKITKENYYTVEKLNSANDELQKTNILVNQQNEEKTVMLKEIHHRVKNNLQIVTSLLRLQARELKDKETIEQFGEATNRILAMSLIHDKMYQTNDLAKIDFKNYIESLTKDLIDSYSINIPIKTDINSEIQLISPKFLVSIALLFNELITNSLKHGFKGKTVGEIKIIIKTENKKVKLSYFDNGKWQQPSTTSSFGLELIETLTEHLDGLYELNKVNGTQYNFQFPYNRENI